MSKVPIKIIGYGYQAPQGLSLEESVDLETSIDTSKILKDRKMQKFLSKQDALAILAATKAWNMANIKDKYYPDKTGIYISVGALPFEDLPLNKMADLSQVNGNFNMELFTTQALQAINPLFTFKCLPNMTLFHVSFNLGLTGSYYITYPGVDQWFDALKMAISDLEDETIDYALLGAVSDQRNYLVEQHISRINKNLIGKHIDSAAFIVLTRENKISDNSIGKFLEIKNKYQTFNPFKEPENLISKNCKLKVYSGVVEPALYLNLNLENKLNNKIIYKNNGCEYLVELSQ